MKKATLYTILVLSIIMLAGCKKSNITIKADNIKTNTMLVRNDGSVQVATVEQFDKQYYKLSELNDFISKEIKEYNDKAGEDVINLGSLDTKDGDAKLVLNFKNLEHYKKFNKVDATFTSATSATKGEITLPDVFVNAKDGSYVSKEVALENENYKVLVVNENTDLIVDGKIKYYSSGVLVSSSKLQTSPEGETIVIYKP